MTDSVVSPIYALRFYAWELLKRNMDDVWDEDNYGGMIPIVPLAEEADLAEFSGPKIVYEYTVLDTGSQSYRGRGSFSMAVLDTNFRRLTETLNVLEAGFGRLDESARDINAFLNGGYNSTLVASPNILKGQVAFGYTNVSFVDGGTPETSEGGNQVGVINIRFDYFVDYNVVTDVTTPAV